MGGVTETREIQRTLDLALRVGEMLLSNGAGAADVTATMSSIAHHLGLRQALVDVTFTTLTMSYQSSLRRAGGLADPARQRTARPTSTT